MKLETLCSDYYLNKSLIRLFNTNPKTKDETSVKNKSATSDNNEAENDESSQHTSHNVSHNSLDKYKASSYMEVGRDITRSSSSSMQTLRRILEIEELRKFSDTVEFKMLCLRRKTNYVILPFTTRDKNTVRNWLL